MKVAGGLDLPRGKGGTGSIAFHVASRLANGRVPPDPGAGPRLSEPYAPITLDRRRVTANVNIVYAPQKVGDTTTTSEKGVQKGTENQTSVRDATSVQTTAQKKDTSARKTGSSKETGKAYRTYNHHKRAPQAIFPLLREL